MWLCNGVEEWASHVFSCTAVGVDPLSNQHSFMNLVHTVQTNTKIKLFLVWNSTLTLNCHYKICYLIILLKKCVIKDYFTNYDLFIWPINFNIDNNKMFLVQQIGILECFVKEHWRLEEWRLKRNKLHFKKSI